MEAPETKLCPDCVKYLAIADFGICRSREDGRNLYCKSCVRKKVYKNRQNRKAYNAARKAMLAQRALQESEGSFDEIDGIYPVRSSRTKLPPNERVLNAIRAGARTQSEIALEAGMIKEEVGDAITRLLLWTRQICTVVQGETRIYFLRPQPQPATASFDDRRSGSFTDLVDYLGPKPRGARA